MQLAYLISVAQFSLAVRFYVMKSLGHAAGTVLFELHRSMMYSEPGDRFALHSMQGGYHLYSCDSSAFCMVLEYMDLSILHSVQPHLHGPHRPVVGAADFADMAAVSLSGL